VWFLLGGTVFPSSVSVSSIAPNCIIWSIWFRTWVSAIVGAGVCVLATIISLMWTILVPCLACLSRNCLILGSSVAFAIHSCAFLYTVDLVSSSLDFNELQILSLTSFNLNI